MALTARYTAGSTEDGYCYMLVYSGGTFFIYRSDDAGPGAELDTDNITLTANTTYIMQFAFVGSSLIGYLKDSGGNILSKLTATDSTYNTGKTGFVIQVSDPTTVAFDDFKIEKSL